MAAHHWAIRRLAPALAAALLCGAALQTAASATAGGTNAGDISGTFSYAQAPPLPPSCTTDSWTLSASGASVAEQESTDAGVSTFAFAGTTTVSATGVAACANAAEDLVGTISLTVTSFATGSDLSCTGSGNYERIGLAFFAEMAMGCSYNGHSLGSSMVTVAGVLVPPTTGSVQRFTFDGAYAFDLSSLA